MYNMKIRNEPIRILIVTIWDYRISYQTYLAPAANDTEFSVRIKKKKTMITKKCL